MTKKPSYEELGKRIYELEGAVFEHTQAEEMLRQSEARVKSIFRAAPIGIGLVSNRVLLDVNDRLCEICGYSRDELIGQSARTLYPTDEDYEYVGREKYRQISEKGTGAVETHFKRKNGQVIDVLLSSTPLDFDDLSKGVTFTALDITERKQAEEALRESEFKYRALIENSSDTIFCVDEKGGYKFTNQLYASTIGKTPEYFFGKTFWDIYPKEHADYRYEAVKRVFQTGKSESLEIEVPLPDKTLYFLATNNPIKDKLGKVILNLTHAANITKLKQAEAERAKYEAQNRQLQKAESLGRMAGAIAHHFNNQLHTVIGNLEMAMDVLPRETDTLNSLSEAMKASRKAAEVSSLMLTYLGKTLGKQEPIDLSEVCRKSLMLLQAASPKGMLFNVDFPASGPVILANTGQIQQMLSNLVINAWEAIGEHEGTIGLSVKTVSRTNIPALNRFPIDWQPKESVYACLEVADMGCGIPDRDIEKLFDPFFTTKFTGRGLGLPVIIGIVGPHGGGVTVESEPRRGSVFRVFIPVSLEEIPYVPVMPETLKTGKAEKSSGIEDGGMVLVVEDEAQVRKIATIMLTHLGYTVLEAKDGVEAVEIFKQHQDEIRCVLSDLTMPRMGGWDTLAALRKLSPDIPVVLSSGYDEAQVMAGEHPERPNAFLGKPYQLKGLNDAVRRAMANMNLRVV